MVLNHIESITGPQIQAARSLLGWSVWDLARRTGLDIAHIQELESAARVPNRRRSNLVLVQTTLEEAGIAFIDSVGVQFRPAGLEELAVPVRTDSQHLRD